MLAIFGLTALRYLTLLTPITLFLGVTLALARLNRDGEMAALSACGIGSTRLLVPIGAFTLLLAIGLTWLALVLTPAASRRIEEIRFSAEQNVELTCRSKPGKFTSPDSGDTVLYAREVVGDELRDVFSQTQRDDRVIVVLAERGRRIVDPVTAEQSFVLYDGRRYEGVPGEGEFLVVEFDEQLVPIRPEDEDELVEVRGREVDARSPALVRARRSRRAALARVVPAFAVRLGAARGAAEPHVAARGPLRAARDRAVHLFDLHESAVDRARMGGARRRVSDGVGMWWVHAVVALLGLWMLARESGWFVRCTARASAAA